MNVHLGGGAHLGNTFYECILNCPRNGILDTVKAENLLLQDEECVHEVFSVGRDISTYHIISNNSYKNNFSCTIWLEYVNYRFFLGEGGA